MISYRYITAYTPAQFLKVLQKTAARWNIDALTTTSPNNTIIYRYSKHFLTLTCNARYSRQVFRAFIRENAEGKVVLYGGFGIPLWEFLPAFLFMVIVAGTAGGATHALLIAALLLGLYLFIHILTALFNTESKRAIVAYIQTVLQQKL